MIVIDYKKIISYIVPKKIIFKEQLYEILELPFKYNIKGYTIKLCNDKIESILLDSPHPNVNPETRELCIPDSLRNHKITKESKSMIYSILYCFNLDDCYFTPWHEITYKKQEFINGEKTNNE